MDIKTVPVRDFVIVYNRLSDEIDTRKSGRWILFSKDRDFSANLAKAAVKQDIVHEAKYVRTGAGPVSFYLNVDDEERHRKIISWLMKMDLFPKDITGKLRDQRFIPDAGARIHRSVMLSDFVDLERRVMRDPS